MSAEEIRKIMTLLETVNGSGDYDISDTQGSKKILKNAAIELIQKRGYSLHYPGITYILNPDASPVETTFSIELFTNNILRSTLNKDELEAVYYRRPVGPEKSNKMDPLVASAEEKLKAAYCKNIQPNSKFVQRFHHLYYFGGKLFGSVGTTQMLLGTDQNNFGQVIKIADSGEDNIGFPV